MPRTGVARDAAEELVNKLVTKAGRYVKPLFMAPIQTKVQGTVTSYWVGWWTHQNFALAAAFAGRQKQLVKFASKKDSYWTATPWKINTPAAPADN